MPLLISIQVDDSAWGKTLPEAGDLACQAVRRTLALEGHERENIAVDVTLASDAAVRKLNRQWRGKDRPTNVLSFPLEPPGEKVPQGRPRQLGDIVLARQTLAREAKEQGKKLSHHFVHLVIHGTLHLLGHDHMTAREAAVMEGKETLLLQKHGIPDPYKEGIRQSPRKR
jgi:probable rRNA maturation factor